MLLRTFRQTHMVLANFSKLGFTPCKTEQPLQGMEFKGKKSTKRLKHTGNLFRKNLYVNSRFYHRSNETILWIEHRHPCNIQERRILLEKEQTSLENNEVEPVKAVQMNIYQSNTYGKDLSQLHFDDEPRVQVRDQVKDQ